MTKEEPELLPCPFCGGAVAVYAPNERSETKWPASVVCHHCGISSQMASPSSDRKQIIAAWNRRPALERTPK